MCYNNSWVIIVMYDAVLLILLLLYTVVLLLYTKISSKTSKFSVLVTKHLLVSQVG